MSTKDLIHGAVIKIFKGKTDNTLHQPIRYSFVGGLAFIVDFGTLYILTEYFHCYYLISALIAFVLGIITNYILSITWVFKSRSAKNRINEILIFILIGIVGLGLNELLIWVITDLLSIYYLISKIMTTVIVFSWNFFACKFLLFNYVSGNE